MAAVKRPQGAPEKPVKDVDDEIADRQHGREQGPANLGEGPKKAQLPRSIPRKAGAPDLNDQAEDPVAEPDAAGLEGKVSEDREDPKQAKARRAREAKKKVGEERERKQRQDQREDEDPDRPKPSMTTPAHLVHDANYYRSRSARKMGFEQTPGIGDFVSGLESPSEGEALGALLPSARARAHPDLPDTDVRPPDFLTDLEAMKDIWMRTRGRMSRRTQELLEGVDLEDLLQMLRTIHESETLVKKPEARITSKLFTTLKDEEDSPLLLGFQDPRLTEPWRLLLDGWEIWVPDGEEEGVELFWEGEAEDDDGRPFEIVQSLGLVGTELTLYTKLDAVEDAVTFDGEHFFRLKTARRSPEASN